MRELFVMDKKDYKGTENVYSRPSVRAIILKDNQVLMVWSKKYDYYKFPGGGIEKGESHTETLIREVKEETGYNIIPETIREYGHVLRRQLSDTNENEIFEQDNFYYFCEIMEECEKQKLDDYEKEEEFTVKWICPFDAYMINRDNANKYNDSDLVIREARVLEKLDKHLRDEIRIKQEEEVINEMGKTGAIIGSTVTAEDYHEMIMFVRKTLGEDDGDSNLLTENIASKQVINYSRFSHTKRVLGWARRLYENSSCKDGLNYEAIMIAAIFHDVGRAIADMQKSNHAEIGAAITRKYLLEHGFSEEKTEYIKSLVERHSDKQMMKDKDIDKNLLVLLEADLLDDMGALGIVMDCMIERGCNPRAKFEDSFDHIMRFTHRQLQINPMVTPEGKSFWDENTKFVNDFIDHMRMELSM